MSFYNESLYNGCLYTKSEFLDATATTLYYGITARILQAKRESPPVMDTLAYGLAQRFNYLQQAIQTFGLAFKIEFAVGSYLDDIWGKIYDVPRLTAESDVSYRARLKTRLGILVGSGTAPNCETVIDSITGIVGGTSITSRYPATALITFLTVDALKRAREYSDIINLVLPEMFAAGVTYNMLIPYIDYQIKAAIQGHPQIEYGITSAAEASREMEYGIASLMVMPRELLSGITASIWKELAIFYKIQTAIKATREISVGITATAQGNLLLPYGISSAIQATQTLSYGIESALEAARELSIGQLAAVEKTFDLLYEIRAYCVLVHDLSYGILAAAATQKSLSYGIKARIKKAS